jgi:hypothetical protein
MLALLVGQAIGAALVIGYLVVILIQNARHKDV